GNAITQAFYTEKILLQYIKEIQALEAYYSHRFRLQEARDLSYRNRSLNNPYAKLKTATGLLILVHSPQSPDLNPIELC
ncbi:hypothetical protein EJ08DRAFT_586807, partial [Tothia fuscella]